MTTVATVMTISGNDPSGGAGLCADIEAILSQGVQALPIVTCVTVQDTCNVKTINPLDATLVSQQARQVLEDMSVDVIKLGLLGSEEIIEAVSLLLRDYPHIPVVMDPVLAAGGGLAFADTGMLDMMRELLLPQIDVLTPNSHEIRLLVPEADSSLAACAALQEWGCEYVLVTGTHENTTKVINRLFHQQKELHSYEWDRLPNTYHGSGCTLASAIAGLLAQGTDPVQAIEEAQAYTWQSLVGGYRLGMGQWHPNRLFWAEGSDEDEETPEDFEDGDDDE
ncbi:MAG: hydroxymethylpyrimidine/phosphomethylpyrimidine kinase [Gammaproteobacteria bacterium]|nr:hydroxymethylpyrimidine/phosphomethylpyrimidine kinase [Gammaproteobacteria bacterium]